MIFSDTASLAQQDGVKVCTFGLSGTGKTTLIATAPKPLVITNEKGTLSIAKYAIPAIVIRTATDLIEAYNFLKNDYRAQQFETICIDGISEFAEVVLSEEKFAKKDIRAAYGSMQDIVAQHIRLFRDLPKNVYMTAKAEMTTQPDGSKKYSPMLPGQKAREGLPYFFDEVFYLGVADYDNPAKPGERVSYRYLQTQPNTLNDAKDRSGALLPIERPDLKYIFDTIRASIARKG